MSPLVPSAAGGTGRTLLRPGPLQRLHEVLGLAIAQDPSALDAALAVRRPLELLDHMWAEVEGVFATHPPAIERLRIQLASASGWRRSLMPQLDGDSEIGRAVASLPVASDDLTHERVLGIVDEGALAILCQATLVVATRSDFRAVFVTPFALALAAAPAEALARVADDLTDPSTLPSLLRGLTPNASLPFVGGMPALLTSPSELVRTELLVGLLAMLQRWEQADRVAFALTRWEGASAAGIDGVEPGDDHHVLLRGLTQLGTDATGVVFTPPGAVAACPGPPEQQADGVRLPLPEGAQTGWVGAELPSLMTATNAYRQHVRDRWEEDDGGVTLGGSAHSIGGALFHELLDVPSDLIANLRSPAAPPRTATNTFTVGPVLRWVTVEPPTPAPGATVTVRWRASGSKATRVRHGDETWLRKADGSITFPAPPHGTHTVEVVPMAGATEGASATRSYRVAVEPKLSVVVEPHAEGAPVVVHLQVEPPVDGQVTAHGSHAVHRTDITNGVGELTLPSDTPDGRVLFELSSAGGESWDRTYGVVHTQQVQERRVVLIRSRVLDDGAWAQASLDALSAASSQAGLELVVIELPVVPDELATLLETPAHADSILDALERLAVAAPGGEDAWWVVWLPGQQPLFEARASHVCQGLVLADVGAANAVVKTLATPPRPLGKEAPMVRVTGRIGDRLDVHEVREEGRRLPTARPTKLALEPPESDEAAWVLLDAREAVVSERTMPLRRGPFAVLVPRPAAAVRLQLRIAGPTGTEVWFDRGRPKTLPTINFDGWDSEQVRFTYRHPDHRGAQLALELGQRNVWVHAAALAPCGSARVDADTFGVADAARVVAVDGWNAAVSELDGPMPTSLGGQIRALADGSLGADWDGDFRWRVDGAVHDAGAVLVPPPGARIELELGPLTAPIGTIAWRPA